MRFEISFNKSHAGKHPQGASPQWWAAYNDGFTPMKLTIEEAMGLIQSGYGFAAVHKGRRKRENFLRGQHVGLDLDDGAVSLEDAQRHPVFSLGAFAYETPSSTAAHPRIRVVFVFDRPVNDVEKYALLSSAIHAKAGQHVDRACKDPSRLFYGNKGGRAVKLPGGVMSLEQAAELFVKDYKRKIEVEKERLARYRREGRVYEGQLEDRRARGLIEAIFGEFDSAPDGEKHHALNRVSYTLGGYVGSGTIDREMVIEIGREHLLRRSAEIKDMRAAIKTMERALEEGSLNPIVWTDVDVTRALEQVHPPLSVIQLEQVQRIVDRALDEHTRGVLISLGINPDAHSFGRRRVVDGDGVIREFIAIEMRSEDRSNVELVDEEGGVFYENDTPVFMDLFNPPQDYDGGITIFGASGLASAQLSDRFAAALDEGRFYRFAAVTAVAPDREVYAQAAQSVAITWPGAELHPEIEPLATVRLWHPLEDLVAEGFSDEDLVRAVRYARSE